MTGDEIKKARLEKRLSRRTLAERCSLHPDTIRYWETSKQVKMNEYAPQRILSALGIAPQTPARTTPRKSTFLLGNFPPKTRARYGVLVETGKTTCGAKTRKGHSCRAKPIPGKARCKFHGGLSTGPKTLEGRARIAEGQRRRKRLREGDMDISPPQGPRT